MSVPDFLIWHCAGCDLPAVGKKKPCDCATNVGVRQGPNGTREQTWWDDPESNDAATERARIVAMLRAPEMQMKVDIATATQTRHEKLETILVALADHIESQHREDGDAVV